MMKHWKRILSLCLVLSLCLGLCPAAAADDAADTAQPLSRVYDIARPEPVGSIEAFGDYWHGDAAVITEDLSQSPGLAWSLTISDATRFSKPLPAGYDPDALLQWGKDPCLGVELLHELGYTGKGIAVAYADQPILNHEQYDDLNLYYTNLSNSNNSMHGPAVLSLLAGKDIGTAPEATVHYYAHAAWLADQTTHADCLYAIIEKNKTLPADKQIRMVGFSDNIDESEDNADAFRAAVQACEEAGIMVWFCGEYGAASFLPMSDRSDPENLTWDSWVRPGSDPNLVYVPAGSRTSSATMGGADYIYWASGGLSWTMPYVLGIYAIGLQIDPSLTQEELRELIVDTAYVNAAEMRIIDPVAFTAAVLKQAGRTADARTLLQAQAARSRYLYALMDTASMTEEDLRAVADHLAFVTDARVLVVDTAAYANAAEVYTALQEDAAVRGGTVAGIQIFGTPSMVPAFEIGYRVQMPSAVDEGGTLLTDLFYGNLNNDVSDLAGGYNVLDHFAEGWDVDLVPQWPVARLPLQAGEYAAFFEKYGSFCEDTGLAGQPLVNFSNPIFASSRHVDDMGTFLNRMNREFGLLEGSDYRLYGNLQGSYPVTTQVLGGFTAENLTLENKKEPVEFLINSHGQRNNIDCCYYVSGEEIRESLISSDTIDQVLGSNPYYLDCWTCNNGYGMADNLTTAALNGQCVGVFSATAIISNNGVNCNATTAQMQRSNFYWFYYNYLKALHEGETRARAFYAGQKAYAEALLADSANGIRGEGNYQFNLYNLLAYENFGVIEPNAAAMALYTGSGYIAQAGQSVPKDPPQGGGNTGGVLPLTDGTPVGNPVDILEDCGYRNGLAQGAFTHHAMTVQRLDNGYYRLTHSFTAPAGLRTFFFSPPSGDVFGYYGPVTTGGRDTLVLDLSAEELLESGSLTINHVRSDDDRFFVFLQASEIMVQPPENHTHTLQTLPAVEATCTSTGLTEGKLCSSCKEITVQQQEIPMAPHVRQFHSENGKLMSRCSQCGLQKVEASAKVSGSTVTLTVAEQSEDVWAYVAVYDQNGRFVEVRIGKVKNGKAQMTFGSSPNGDLTAFFLGAEANPLTDPLEF